MDESQIVEDEKPSTGTSEAQVDGPPAGAIRAAREPFCCGSGCFDCPF